MQQQLVHFREIFMTNDKYGSKFFETEVGQIEEVKKFKYLGRTIQEGRQEKAAFGRVSIQKTTKTERTWADEQRQQHNESMKK